MDHKFRQLRKKAEALLKQKGIEKPEQYYDDIDKLVEELSIHQIELEMQNQELRETTQKLVNSEKRYKELYMNAPVAYFTLNQTGNIVELNHAAADLLKIPIQAFRYTSVFAYLEEKSKNDFSKYFKKVFNSDKIEYGAITFKNSNNELVHTNLSAVSYFDSDLKEQLVRCSVLDVRRIQQLQTLSEELNNTNEELNASNDELRETSLLIEQERQQFLSILDNIPEIIYVADIDTKKVLFANKHLKKILGRDITGELCYKAIQEQTNTCDFCTNKYINETNQPYFWEFYNSILDKHFYIMDRKMQWTDQKEVRFELAIDITDRKKAEEKLSQINHRLEASMSGGDMAWWEMELPSGKIIFNPNKALMLGRKPEDFTHYNDFMNLVHPDDHEPAMQAMHKLINGESDVYKTQYRIKSIDNQYVWFDDSGIISSKENGKIIMTGIVRNINQQKIAEEKLKESLTLFDKLVNTIPVGVYISSMKKKGEFEFDYVSNRWCEIYKLNKQDVLADATIAINRVHPDDRATFMEKNIQSATQLKPFEWEGRFTMPNGDVRWSRLESVPYQDFEDVKWFGFAQDITDRKQAEQALIESEEKFKAISNSANDAIILINNNGEVIFWNHNAEKIFQYTEAEISGKNLHEILSPEKYREAQNKGFEIFKKSGHGNAIGKTTELEAVRKSGEIFPVEVSLSTIKIKDEWNAVGIVRDITERKKAEQALKESEEKYRLITENASDVISIYNVSKNKITYTSPAVYKVHGYTQEEALSMPHEKFYLPEYALKANEKIRFMANEFVKNPDEIGKKSFLFEAQVVHKNGKVFWVEIRNSYRYNKHGEIELYGITRNIDDRKKVEEALIESEKSLNEAQRLSRIGNWHYNLTTGEVKLSDEMYNIIGLENKIQDLQVEILEKYFTPDSWQIFTNAAQTAQKTGKGYEIELEVLRNNESNRISLSRGETVLNDKGVVTELRGTLQDITERKEAEEALKRSEEKFRNLIKDMPVGVLLQGAQAEILLSNPKALEMLGLTEDQILGKTSFDPDWNVIHEDGSDFPGNTHPVTVAIATAKPVRGVIMGVYHPKKKERVWLLVDAIPQLNNGDIQQVICTFIDITDRKKAEQALKESEENFKTIIENSSNVFYKHDVNHKLIYASPQIKELLGYEQYEAKRLWTDFVTDNPINKIAYNKTIKAIETGERQEVYDAELQHKNGNLKRVEIREAPVVKGGKTIEIVGAITDVTERREFEEKIKTSEEKYRLITENASDVIWILNLTKKKYTYISPSVYALRGYTPDEAMEQDINQSLTPESAKIVTESIGEILPQFLANPKEESKKIHRHELRQTCKDGSIIWIETNTRYQFNKDNEIEVIGISRNIGDRKKAEERIKLNSQRLDDLLELSQQSINVKKTIFDYALNTAVKVTKSQYGYIYFYSEEKQQFVLNTWSGDVMPDCKVMSPNTIYDLDNTGIWGEVVRQRKPIIVNDFQAENPLKKGFPKGHVQLKSYLSIPFFQDKEIVAVIGVANKTTEYDKEDVVQLNLLMETVWNIYDRKKQEQAIANRLHYEEKLAQFSSTLLLDAPDVINNSLKFLLEASDSSRVYLFENFVDIQNKLAMKQTYEVCAEGIEPQIDNPELQHLIYEDDGFGRWQKIFSENKIINGIVTDFPKAERDILEHQDIKSLLAIPVFVHQKWFGFIGFDDTRTYKKWSNEDVDLLRTASEMLGLYIENHRNKQTIEKRNTELKKANRLKSEFLANMSHEIRTPMNAVIGFAEILNDKLADKPEYKSFIEGVVSGGKNLISLINDILDLSKIEAGRMEIKPEPVNLRKLIEDIEQIFSVKIKKKNLEFILDIDKRLPPSLMLDQTRIRQILFNLVGNAIKFTDKGAVLVSVKIEGDVHPESKIDLYFEVKDTGIGIPDNQLEKIFQAFQQTDGQSHKYGGTGLGLPITKRLTEAMNGTIQVESKPGEGSVFSIHFKSVIVPAVETERKTNEQNLSPDKIVFNEPEVLLVDDVASNRDVIKYHLTQLNCRIVEAENGKEAINFLKKNKPDLILMDIQMPVMTGEKAAQLIKKQEKLKSIPIIALTALAMKEQEEKYKSVFDDYLKKPIEIKDLVNSLIAFLPHTKNEKADVKEETVNYANELASDIEKIGKLPGEFIEQYKTGLLPLYEEAYDIMDINLSKEFALKIIELGIMFKVDTFINYGTDLKTAAEAYKLGETENILEQFKELNEIIVG